MPSPSGKLLAYTVDGSGYETYTIRFKDLGAATERDEQIEGTAGGLAWAGDGLARMGLWRPAVHVCM